jgi:hypothetical protein
MPADEPARSDLIAKTPGAQTRESAIQHLRKRRASYVVPEEPEPDFAAREPMPIIDAPEAYAEGYLRRRAEGLRPALRIVDGGAAKDGDNSSNG